MKRFFLFFLFLFFLFVIVACGKRTAPVPYEQPELLLPKLKVKQPNYLGNWLQISWEIDSVSGELEAETYILKVFEQTEICKYCLSKPIDIIEYSKTDTGKHRSILFRSSGKKFTLFLKDSIHEKWQTRDLFYFTLGYRLESGLISDDSDKIWPVRTKGISKPIVTIVKQDHDKSSGKMNIILKWTRQIERIYRRVHQASTGREVTQYYGINLYQINQPDQLILAEKLNNLPLLSGVANISFQKSQLYAAHVNRFGNESNRILIAENVQGNQ